MVTALSGYTTLVAYRRVALLLSSLEDNSVQSAMVGEAVELPIYAVSVTCTVAQISSTKQQSGKW